MMQSLLVLHTHPPGHGPVWEIFMHSSVVRLVMPSNTAWEMVMILPTPAASMYAVEIDVLDGVDDALLNQGLLQMTYVAVCMCSKLRAQNVLKLWSLVRQKREFQTYS